MLCNGGCDVNKAVRSYQLERSRRSLGARGEAAIDDSGRGPAAEGDVSKKLLSRNTAISSNHDVLSGTSYVPARNLATVSHSRKAAGEQCTTLLRI